MQWLKNKLLQKCLTRHKFDIGDVVGFPGARMENRQQFQVRALVYGVDFAPYVAVQDPLTLAYDIVAESDLDLIRIPPAQNFY